MKIKRWKDNPIIKDAHNLAWCGNGTRNPGAILDGDTVRMLFTANAQSGCKQHNKMCLGYAESKDGFHFECRHKPFLEPSTGDTFFDRTGIDDPRITQIDDHFYFTYASLSPVPDIPTDSHKNEKPMWLLGLRRTGLARTKDWLNVERLGPITHPLIGDANAVIFSEKNKWKICHAASTNTICTLDREPLLLSGRHFSGFFG